MKKEKKGKEEQITDEPEKTEIPKLTINTVGFKALHEIAAFLGGILFTTLVFLIQYKDNYCYQASIFMFKLPITQFLFLSIPLSISSILFILSAIICGLSGLMGEEDFSEKFAVYTIAIFFGGVLFLFISILEIFFMIDLAVGIIGMVIIFLFLFFAFFIYKYIGVYWVNKKAFNRRRRWNESAESWDRVKAKPSVWRFCDMQKS